MQFVWTRNANLLNCIEVFMRAEILIREQLGWAGAAFLALVLGFTTGCRNQPSARTDQQITSDIQGRIKGESALANQNIEVSVANGVATLNGTVTDEASRALAANDSGTVSGVKTVINNLTVQPVQQAVATPPPSEPQTMPPPEPKPSRSHKEAHSSVHEAARQDKLAPSQVAEAAPAPTAAPVTPPAAPPPPPKPVVREITLPAGTVLPIRITESLSSKDAQPNEAFHGSLAGDVGSEGVIVFRHGDPVLGRVIDAKDAAHFKGSAILSLELTQIAENGQKITLVTDPFSKQGEGRGKNTVEKAAGGAALGGIIGAIAGGGKGAAIGSVAGGAAGTGVNAATRGQQVTIPTETLINFQLQSPITVKVTIPPPGSAQTDDPNEPQLQRH
jgi:hypothetical protein